MKISYLKKTAKYLLHCLPALVIVVIFMTGCDKFEGDQTVPSYLRVDSIRFITDNTIQGTSNQKFDDAWIYVDDQVIGGFEIPFTIPILTEGKHKLTVSPGIVLNGISDTRAPYPLIEPIIIEDFNFITDSVIPAFGSTTYYSNVEFRWMEDFEDASLAILASANSDTGIYRTSPAGNQEAFLDEYSEYSGISYLDHTRPYVQLVSDDGNGQGFAFDKGDYVFLELNYKTSVTLVAGVYVKLTDGTIEERPLLNITPSDHWNKIYINFTPFVYETADAVNYKIYLESYLVDSSSGYVMLDNIKLVTRPNL